MFRRLFIFVLVLLFFIGCQHSLKKNIRNVRDNRFRLTTKVFSSVVLSQRIEKKNIKIGEKFYYFVELIDYLPDSKKTVFYPSRINFSGLKLVQRKKIFRKIKKGKKSIYRYTFVAKTKGRKVIKPLSVFVRNNKKRKKIVLSSFYVFVKPKKKFFKNRMFPFLKKKSNFWTKIYKMTIFILMVSFLVGIPYLIYNKWGRRFFNLFRK